MIIMDKPPIELIEAEIRILGMPFVTFFLVLGIGLVVFCFCAYFVGRMFYYDWLRKKIRKALEGKVQGVIIGVGKPIQRVLMEEFKGEARVVTAKNRATFTVANFAKAPEGVGAIDTYYLLEEHDHLDFFPLDKPKAVQQLIKTYIFNENDPCPKVPHDPSKWDTERYTKITSTIATLSKEESNLQILVSDMAKHWKDFTDLLMYVKKLSLIQILLFVLIGVGLINAYLSFNAGSTSSNVLKLLSQFIIGK